jgi:hypothetical protein
VSKDWAKGRPPTSPPPIVMRHLLGGALIAPTKAERVGEERQRHAGLARRC